MVLVDRFYFTNFSFSWQLPLLRSVHRSIFMASVVERSETPMNIGAHFKVLFAAQLLLPHRT
jgi:hypothetical protein